MRIPTLTRTSFVYGKGERGALKVPYHFDAPIPLYELLACLFAIGGLKVHVRFDEAVVASPLVLSSPLQLRFAVLGSVDMVH
jgi:hypothetical protein